MQYKVTIDAVDGERFYIAGGPDRTELLAFLHDHDHEGSSITLDWCQTTEGGDPGLTSDSDRVYRILAGEEDV
jgi:hypothetical protein